LYFKFVYIIKSYSMKIRKKSYYLPPLPFMIIFLVGIFVVVSYINASF
jgi:hypothetical protein